MGEMLSKNSKELGLVAAMILILIVLFSPIPSVLLDLSILINFGLALTILLMTFYVPKPVEFSTFPSLLLISTLFRLSLNVAATRLILTSANAGEVINSIGAFAVGGNFVVGLVVFLILVVVQYVVVTSGAQRVSEVAARFTLDSMPGQQMSIDADLNMGLIDQKEAVRRRAALEKESSFYGAMDGASKFVKGDAIAGVIILLIDIIAGWIVGMLQMNMAWNEALQRFTLLTIGDGIATQLPALIISIATGIIVTRSSADKELGMEVFRQLSSTPRIFLIVTGALTLLLLLPGMPKWPIILLGGLAFLAWRRMREKGVEATNEIAAATEAADATPAASILSIALGATLGEAWKPSEALILDRITSLREAQERALGFTMPALKLVPSAELGGNEYEIRVFATRYAGGEIEPERVLAIKGDGTRKIFDGIETLDPAFGLPALWIEAARAGEARDAGYTIVDPITVLMTHLSEFVRAEAPALLSRPMVVSFLDGVRARQPGLVEELVPTLLSISDVQRVLQNLLAEGVSIAMIDLIVEHLVDLARTEKDAGALNEALRQRLGQAICNKLKNRRPDLAVISLDPRLESQIQSSVAATGKTDTLALDPRLADQVIRKLSALASDMTRQGQQPVLLCGPDIRRQMRALTRRAIPRLSVLSVNEIPMTMQLSSHGIVKLDAAQSQPQRNTPPSAEISYARSEPMSTADVLQ